jgi:hypothetical protein
MKVAHPRLTGPESGTAIVVTVEPAKRKFLQKLGIETSHNDESRSQSGRAHTRTQRHKAAGTRVSPPAADGNEPGFERDEWACPQTNNVVLMEEPLKYDNRQVMNNAGDDACPSDHDAPVAPKRRKTGSPDAAKTKLVKRCTFNESVQVIPIPMRSEYSHSVRSCLWAGAKEIQEMAARNTVEFASEGWDWRTVTLDESMYICRATGELVHPVHYEIQHSSFPAYYHHYHQS